MPGPLNNVRVLDFSTVLMGPYACEVLAEHGADVIKIESLTGDGARAIGPVRSPDMGPLFLGLNRSKRSISIDIKKPAGHAILRKLVAKSDVLVTNVRPAALARLGLSYEAVHESNPSIIFCRLFGYGENGPYAGRPAYDDLIQGAAAIPSLVADAAGSEPRYVPMNIADRTVGLSAACSISMALYHRERTGQGQQIDIPMFETMASFVLSDHLFGRAFEPAIGKPGYVRLLSSDRRPYRTKDGYVCVVVYTTEQWRRLLTYLEDKTLEEDPRFRDIAARTSNVDAVLSYLSKVLLERTTSEWLRVFDQLDIPCAALNTLDSLIDDPHLNAVGFFKVIEHPTEGTIRTTVVPANWSQTPPSPSRECARLGEHTEEILEQLEYSPIEILELARQDVIRRPASERKAS